MRGICLRKGAGGVWSWCSITGLIPSVGFVGSTEAQVLAHVPFAVSSCSIV